MEIYIYIYKKNFLFEINAQSYSLMSKKKKKKTYTWNNIFSTANLPLENRKKNKYINTNLVFVWHKLHTML